MRRMAFFVEGQTEQVFVNRLIRYILGPKQTNIVQKKIKGGTNSPKVSMTRHRSISRTPEYEVLIVDCGADNRVKSEMLENLENLNENNYQYLIGLRDLYPLPLEEFDRLNKGLQFLPPRLRKLPATFEIIIAVREIESWFLAESTHFQKIDKRLTCDFIQKKLGFNPELIDPTVRVHPASDINNIYRLVGQSYAKKYNQTSRMIHSLDIKQIVGPLRTKIKGLDDLITVIEEFRGEEEQEYKKSI